MYPRFFTLFKCLKIEFREKIRIQCYKLLELLIGIDRVNPNGMGLLDVAWVQGADSECTYNSHKTTKRKTGHIAIQSNKTVNSSRQMQTLLVRTFMLFCRSSISVGNEKKLLTSQPLLYCLTLWKWLIIIGKKSCLGSGYQFLSFKPHKRLETNS